MIGYDMSARSKKYEELTARIGNSEPHFCGVEKGTRTHTIIQQIETRTAMFATPIDTYIFFLKCTGCGHTVELFRF